MQATTYIKDLRGRVEMLKQRRDDSYAKILQVTIKCSRSNVSNDVAPGSTGAAHSDVNLTMNSNKCIEFHKVIHAIEQDRCLEIVRASSCMVEGGKIVYTIECRVYAIHLQQKCFHFGSVFCA
uniref:Uncharacterized protein n=1 Tax=Arundo donax TaxID=35708 RepID=A0A0A9HPG5_ARUDO